MAAPTAPTKSTIVSTALGDAGYGSDIPSSLTTVAEGRWFSEVKNDIFHLIKDAKFFQLTKVTVITKGLSRYSYPSDFSHDLSLKLLSGTTTGTAQAGSASSITLAASDTGSEGTYQGREILITAGTGVASLSQVTAYNATTKVATVSPDFDTAPDNTSTYLVIDREYEVIQKPVWEWDRSGSPMTRNRPKYFSPIGDEDYGEFIFDVAPDAVYGMRLRYYINLMTLDESGTLMSTLLQRFENVFYDGIYAKCLRRDKDDNWMAAEQRYRASLNLMAAREKYGAGLNDIQDTVSDYV